MPLSDHSDEQLAESAQTGSQLAFTELANRYWPKLLRYVQRLTSGSSDAEDLVQTSLLKAYQNLQSFHTDRRFSPWIYRITHNTVIDHFKSHKRDPLPFFDPEVLFPHPVAPDRPDTEAERASIQRMLEQHIEQLDARYREPLVLRYLESMSYKEIADILHVPTGTVSIRIKRGLEKLRTILPNDAV